MHIIGSLSFSIRVQVGTHVAHVVLLQVDPNCKQTTVIFQKYGLTEIQAGHRSRAFNLNKIVYIYFFGFSD